VDIWTQAWTNVCSEDNPVPGRYSPVALFHSGPADGDPSSTVYGERQVVAAPGQFQVTFRARERHVTEWTQLNADKPATINAGPPSDDIAEWDAQLRHVRNLTLYTVSIILPINCPISRFLF